MVQPQDLHHSPRASEGPALETIPSLSGPERLWHVSRVLHITYFGPCAELPCWPVPLVTVSLRWPLRSVTPWPKCDHLFLPEEQPRASRLPLKIWSEQAEIIMQKTQTAWERPCLLDVLPGGVLLPHLCL